MADDLLAALGLYDDPALLAVAAYLDIPPLELAYPNPKVTIALARRVQALEAEVAALRARVKE
jgi:hypothetical protein